MILTIIVVSYNTKDYTLKCLRSIKEQHHSLDDIEVIVVDNSSIDGSVEAIQNDFPWVILIKNKNNLGFAAANNIGLQKAKGKLILLLNSDTVLLYDTLDVMINIFAENKNIGAATARLELPDKSLDLASHRGFPTPWNALTYFLGLERIFPNTAIFSGYHQTFKDFNLIHEVDAISGACFFVRSQVVKQVGLLDERFFMYAEDIDWCIRIKEAGWKIYFNPNAKVVHFKKRSGREKENEIRGNLKASTIRMKTENHFYETMKVFYDKHYKNRYPKIVNQVVLFGIFVKSKVSRRMEKS